MLKEIEKRMQHPSKNQWSGLLKIKTIETKIKILRKY